MQDSPEGPRARPGPIGLSRSPLTPPVGVAAARSQPVSSAPASAQSSTRTRCVTKVFPVPAGIIQIQETKVKATGEGLG